MYALSELCRQPMTLGLILPLSDYVVILLRPCLLLSPLLNTLIVPGLHGLSLLLGHRLMLFQVMLLLILLCCHLLSLCT